VQPQPATQPQPAQPELFSIEHVQGYALLPAKERKFVQALFEGCSQKAAATAAGVTGSEEYIRKAASKLVRKGNVQALMNQAWAKSGASIDGTIHQAVQIQARAFNDWQQGDSPERREAAFAEWAKTSTLLASIHGKLSLKVEMSGSVDVNHVLITPKLQSDLVAQRRTFVQPLENRLAHAN